MWGFDDYLLARKKTGNTRHRALPDRQLMNFINVIFRVKNLY